MGLDEQGREAQWFRGGQEGQRVDNPLFAGSSAPQKQKEWVFPFHWPNDKYSSTQGKFTKHLYVPGTVLGAGRNEYVKYNSYIPRLQSNKSAMGNVGNKHVNICITFFLFVTGIEPRGI